MQFARLELPEQTATHLQFSTFPSGLIFLIEMIFSKFVALEKLKNALGFGCFLTIVKTLFTPTSKRL